MPFDLAKGPIKNEGSFYIFREKESRLFPLNVGFTEKGVVGERGCK